MKNLGVSVRQRLLNLARKEGLDFDYLLRQFVIQRVLYRLSVSNHAKQFYLKGALLFWVWDNTFHRPTRDIDLLGFGSSDPPTLKNIFSNVFKIQCDDGLTFDIGSITTQIIKEEAAYQGVRISGTASLNKAIVPYQIDIGFGDVVTPEAEYQKVPSYLNLPQAEIKVYPVETIIAEKFQAMVKLDEANSRMKDFFDLWFIANTMKLKERLLADAIEATFMNRKTEITASSLDVFSSTFLSNKNKNIQWQAFLNKNRLEITYSFSQVQERLKFFLEPVYLSILERERSDRVWNSGMWSWQDFNR